MSEHKNLEILDDITVHAESEEEAQEKALQLFLERNPSFKREDVTFRSETYKVEGN